MSNCKSICKLCKHLVISSSVTFTDGTLIVNIPQNTFFDGEKVCIVIAQTIPTTATITAPVAITIGAGTVQYPLLNCDCSLVTACGISSRTKYCTCVETNATGASFKLIGKNCCVSKNNLASIDGTIPTAEGGQ